MMGLSKATKFECGATMDGYGNSCFFNSLWHSLQTLGFNQSSYRDYILMGDWAMFQKAGRMVDTVADYTNIVKLANCLGVIICVYDEVSDGIVSLDTVTVFGSMSRSEDLIKPRCRIAKLKGRAHFNAIEIDDTARACEAEDTSFRCMKFLKTAERAAAAAEEKTRKLEEETRKLEEKSRVIAEMERRIFNATTAMEEARAAAAKRKDMALCEEKIISLTLKVSVLESEIDGWTKTLTSLGSDGGVEQRLKKLFVEFRDAMDQKRSFVSYINSGRLP